MTKRTKFEIIRRLRLGDLRRVLWHRCGHELPDDDAGREYLDELLRLTLDEHLANVIAISAPWMDSTEAQEVIKKIIRLPAYSRRLSGKELGERLRFTNVEREGLKAWRIAPVDMTAEQLAEQRKAKDRARKAIKRQQAGGSSRAAYIANSLTQLEPWKAEGISRPTWYRRRRETGCSAIKVTKARNKLSHASSKPKCRKATKRNVSRRQNLDGKAQVVRPMKSAIEHCGTTCLTKAKWVGRAPS